jgi:NodT family efflux transporter outer membrane factor (OMF) lipoprotein
MVLTLVCVALLSCGCTSFRDYIHNGFKVGPNYERPPAPVAKNWIDGDDIRKKTDADDLSAWWKVFNDPTLDSLICQAYHQNLTLRQASFRILQARAQLGIAVGNLFPQTQTMNGTYTRNAISLYNANGSVFFAGKRWFQQFGYNFNLGWEVDFWGRIRRAIEANEATLDASVEDYDDVLVTLLGDIASNYIQIRTLEQRIEYAKTNVEIQLETLKIVEGGVKAKILNELDLDQARSTLYQTQADIPELEISLRLANNLLCILLGIPPEDLHQKLGRGGIPTAPIEVAVGIPAELLRRRPDIRRAERLAAAQCAVIGISEAEFYPHISFNGTMGWSSQYLKNIFKEEAIAGNLGPAFNWNILNYGRILNDVRFQDARFQELVAAYQQQVLDAQREVENGLVTFARAQVRARLQAMSVTDAEKAVKIALAQYTAGVIDLTRVTLLEQTLVQQQDTLAQAQGQIALGLVQTYTALGGGWEIRLTDCEPAPLPIPGGTPPPPARSPVLQNLPGSRGPANPGTPSTQPQPPAKPIPDGGAPAALPPTGNPNTPRRLSDLTRQTGDFVAELGRVPEALRPYANTHDSSWVGPSEVYRLPPFDLLMLRIRNLHQCRMALLSDYTRFRSRL